MFTRLNFLIAVAALFDNFESMRRRDRKLSITLFCRRSSFALPGRGPVTDWTVTTVYRENPQHRKAL